MHCVSPFLFIGAERFPPLARPICPSTYIQLVCGLASV